MSWDEARFYLELGNIGLTGVVGLYVWITSKNRVTHARITQLENDVDTRLDNLSTRMTAQEERAKHAPTHNDFIRVHERLDKLSEEISELCGASKAMNRQLDMINQYLLQERK